MKMLALILSSVLTVPAWAAPIDDESLQHALVKIAHQRDYHQRGRTRRAQRAVGALGLGALSTMPISYFYPHPNVLRVGMVMSVMAVGVGVVGLIRARTQVPVVVRLPEGSTPDQVDRFFALSLMDQYDAARENPDLARFVLEVSDALDTDHAGSRPAVYPN